MRSFAVTIIAFTMLTLVASTPTTLGEAAAQAGNGLHTAAQPLSSEPSGLWGDTDCDGEIGEADALSILFAEAGITAASVSGGRRLPGHR